MKYQPWTTKRNMTMNLTECAEDASRRDKALRRPKYPPAHTAAANSGSARASAASRPPKYSHARNGHAKRKKKRSIFPVFLILLAIACGMLIFRRSTGEGYWTIAVFGVDSRDGKLEKGALSDVEMLCSINRKTGEIRLVSVFRDSYLRIDSEGKLR